MTLIAGILSLVLTYIGLTKFTGILPTDGGKALEEGGEVSKGKFTSAGIIFMSIHVVIAALFLGGDLEFFIYLLAVVLEMVAGFIDDGKFIGREWNQLEKAVIDVVAGAIVAINYVAHNGSMVHIYLFNISFKLPAVIFVLLAILLVFVAVNVVNCTDGIDGLCGTLWIVSAFSFVIIMSKIGGLDTYCKAALLIVINLLIYLMFNWNPSTILMGDSGSRALGLILAVYALKTGAPLLFIPLALVFIIDGGLGLFKQIIIRLLRQPQRGIPKEKRFLHQIICPVHTHMRVRKKWTNLSKIVFTFSGASLVICVITLLITCSRL